MSMPVKAAVRATLLALVVALSLTSVPTGATASSTTEARANSACAAATATVAQREATKKKLVQKRKVAKKRLTKARKAHKSARAAVKVKAKKKVKVAKKKLTKAKKKVTRIKKRVHDAKVAQASACAPVPQPLPGTPQTPQQKQADAFGQLLALITNNLGGSNPLATLSLDELTGLLNTLAPGLADSLDPSILQALLGGITGGNANPQVILDLLGGSGGVDPAQLQALFAALAGGLGGDFDPADFTGLFEDLLAQLAGLGGGGATLPELSPAGLLGLLGLVVDTLSDNVLDQLELGMVGDLLKDLVNGVNPTQSQITQLRNLVNAMSSGEIDQLKNVPLLGAIVGGLTNGYNGVNGLPRLSDVPGLGPILGSLVCGLPIVGSLLCGPLG